MGYAHGVSTATPLGPRDFSGGENTVVPRLQGLGFTVRYLPHLDWKRDEIILACALVESNGWRQLGEGDERVQELSALLQSPAIHPIDRRHPDFRNPASVARKTQNIASVHPAHRGAPSHTSRLDTEVVDDFRADPVGMHATADRIRELMTRDEARNDDLPDLDADDEAGREGGLAFRAHLRRERDPRLRQKKLADTKRRGLSV